MRHSARHSPLRAHMRNPTPTCSLPTAHSSPSVPVCADAGYLVSVDSYMNLQLASTEEWIDGQFSGNLGEVLIRCNNVLYIRGVPEEDDA